MLAKGKAKMSVFIELQDAFTKEVFCVNSNHIVCVMPYEQEHAQPEFRQQQPEEFNSKTCATLFLTDGRKIIVFDQDAYIASHDYTSFSYGEHITASGNMKKLLNTELTRMFQGMHVSYFSGHL